MKELRGAEKKRHRETISWPPKLLLKLYEKNKVVAGGGAAEIVKRRFMKDLKASKITIGTEELPQEEGGTRNVSTMEIMLTRD